MTAMKRRRLPMHAPRSPSRPRCSGSIRQGHALRIVHVGDSAPRDRETLYWLNVLEIPPKAPEAEGKNVLQFAFRHRLKLFHRPAGLKSPPESAASMLRWTMDRKDKLISLRVDNPSPYYVSFHAIDVVGEKDATRMALGRHGRPRRFGAFHPAARQARREGDEGRFFDHQRLRRDPSLVRNGGAVTRAWPVTRRAWRRIGAGAASIARAEHVSPWWGVSC